MKIEIRNRWSDEVIFSHECEENTILKTVKAAHDANADLSYTNLSNANLRDACLHGACLHGASLDGARLDGASLHGASLVNARLVNARLDGARLDGARLDGASLVNARLVNARLDGARLVGASLVNARLDGARLVGASLDGARLDGASLHGASLVNARLVNARLDGARLVGARLDGACLHGASLDGARLDGADLTPIRDDIWAVLSSAPMEVAALIDAIKNGRVDGSTYSGECACLVGTIAKTRRCNVESLGSLKPNSGRPAERFFLSIRKGDTPETSQFSTLALQWCQEWLDTMTAAFCKPQASTDIEETQL